jgi:hypothetical protein
VYTIGYARKVPDPGSRGASIIATIGPAILLYALFLRLLVSQMAKGTEPTAGRFWRMLGIDLYNLGTLTPLRHRPLHCLRSSFFH